MGRPFYGGSLLAPGCERPQDDWTFNTAADTGNSAKSSQWRPTWGSNRSTVGEICCENHQNPSQKVWHRLEHSGSTSGQDRSTDSEDIQQQDEQITRSTDEEQGGQNGGEIGYQHQQKSSTDVLQQSDGFEVFGSASDQSANDNGLIESPQMEEYERKGQFSSDSEVCGYLQNRHEDCSQQRRSQDVTSLQHQPTDSHGQSQATTENAQTVTTTSADTMMNGASVHTLPKVSI